MKAERKPKYFQAEQGGQRERWLISYTDLVTILLILFAAAAAQGLHLARNPLPNVTLSKPIPQPAPQPAPVPAPAVAKPEQQPTPDPAPDPVLLEAEKKLQAQGVDSRLEKRGLVISLPQAVLFPSGEDQVVAAALPMVSQIAEVIASVPNKVALVGHSDSVPIHNRRFRSNWELSAARSVHLLELLTTRYGIAESRLSVESFASNDPKNSNETPEGRAENRRVEILLLDDAAQ
jgi:chemotaxis protein MotB